MKKMTFLIAALALSLGSTAYAFEKVDTTESCCRAGDDGCTTAYTASCNAGNTVGYFCSTDKNDKDGDGDKTDRVVWEMHCAQNETCQNQNGNISCVTSACAGLPSCSQDGSSGTFCDGSGNVKTKTCETGTVCNISDTGYLDCIVDDPNIPTGQCNAETDQVGCNQAGTIGYYCNSNTHEWGTKVCTNGKKCTINGSSVSCQDADAPSGPCDPATVMGKCSSDGKTGWYCKSDGSGWQSKTCSDANCTVGTKVNSVSCGGGGGGEQGDECDQGAMECTSATAGWYCNNGNKKDYTCENSTCGTKTYNGKKKLTCCVQKDSSWVDAKYDSDVCDNVYDSGSNPPSGGCGQANYCSSDNLIAYNCDGSTMKPTPCLDGKTCEVKNGTATCVGSINNTGNKDKDDDGGCSATGAGLALGWLGLALIPAIRRRSRK
jgi:hypothetical protein